jgi:ubiquinone/menaquinone biosynthesis C-methylase UbiE
MDLTSAKTRLAPQVTRIRRGVARRLAPVEPGAGGNSVYAGYGELWKPESEKHAMQLVMNVTDHELFEESGRNDAAAIGKLVHSPDDVAMDFGCGMGRVVKYVAPMVSSVWAVDASSTMLGVARQRLTGESNVRYAQCHDTSVPDIADDSVDVAYSLLVLQHMDRDDAFRVLLEIRRMLKPGGRALFTFPNLLSETYTEAFVRHIADRDVHPGRARYYTPQEVAHILPVAGFQVDELVEETEIRAYCS